MFGDTLRQLRKSKGLTQQELADIIGVEQSSIGKYEGKDKKVPSDSVKERIADYFGVTIDYLMGREEVQKNESELSPDTTELLILFNSLNDKGKETAMNTMRALAAYPEMYEREERKHEKGTGIGSDHDDIAGSAC